MRISDWSSDVCSSDLLQYQIKRCSAPCVQRVTAEDYGRRVDEARDFLQGRNRRILDEWQQRMQAASDALDFEAAAEMRDRIRALAHISPKQDLNIEELGDADVIGVQAEGGPEVARATCGERGCERWYVSELAV